MAPEILIIIGLGTVAGYGGALAVALVWICVKILLWVARRLLAWRHGG
jgi:hypothetical protein